MLQCTLAPVQPSQSSLVRGNTLRRRVRLGVRKALAGEDQGLLQKQEHSTREISDYIPSSLFSGNSQQSERGDRLNQKCLSDSNGSRISKATAPFKSAANVRAETPRTWTLLTRLSGLRQRHHEGRHQPARHPEVGRSCRVWLMRSVSVPSCASCGIGGNTS